MALSDAKRERHREYMRRRYQNDPVHRAKQQARSAVGHALRDGRLTKTPCPVCGSEDVVAHHATLDGGGLDDVTFYCLAHKPEAARRADIPGFPGYAASSDGNIWSRQDGPDGPSWRLKKLSKTANGYLVTGLTVGGVTKTYLVQRLVLLAFVGPCPPGMEAAHDDGNRENNTLANLRWATPTENQGDRRRHGTAPTGTANGRAKLDEAAVVELATDVVERGMSVADAAKKYGVSGFSVRAVVSGKSWPHVARPGYSPPETATAVATYSD